MTVPLKGWNVAYVEYSRGCFAGNRGTWIETGVDRHFTFHETHRDEWSVYAEDKSRNYRLQIDIWRNKIRLARGSADYVDYYDITTDTRKDHIPAKGWTVGYAGTSGHSFREYARGQWVERSFGNAKFKATFVEQRRDEWSVYMYDKSRDYHIQIDLWRKKVRLQRKSGGDWHDYYDVLTSST